MGKKCMYYEHDGTRCPFKAVKHIGIMIGGHRTILHYCEDHGKKMQTTIDEYEVDLYARIEEMD